MECMCTQTRPWFILSSERVLWGVESDAMLTPQEKFLLPEAQEEDQTHDAASCRIASPTHEQLSYSGPSAVQ